MQTAPLTSAIKSASSELGALESVIKSFYKMSGELPTPTASQDIATSPLNVGSPNNSVEFNFDVDACPVRLCSDIEKNFEVALENIGSSMLENQTPSPKKRKRSSGVWFDENGNKRRTRRKPDELAREKTNQCPYVGCNKSYTSKCSLHLHVRRHHSEVNTLKPGCVHPNIANTGIKKGVDIYKVFKTDHALKYNCKLHESASQKQISASTEWSNQMKQQQEEHALHILCKKRGITPDRITASDLTPTKKLKGGSKVMQNCRLNQTLRFSEFLQDSVRPEHEKYEPVALNLDIDKFDPVIEEQLLKLGDDWADMGVAFGSNLIQDTIDDKEWTGQSEDTESCRLLDIYSDAGDLNLQGQDDHDDMLGIQLKFSDLGHKELQIPRNFGEQPVTGLTSPALKITPLKDYFKDNQF